MYSSTHSIWWPRLSALVLAALAAGSAVYWALKWPGSATAPMATVAMNEAPAADPLVLARVLGGGNSAVATAPAPAVISASSRMALVGVVANGQNGGSALISVDGKPARPYRVGSQVEEGLLLQSVGPRRALLAADLQGPASLTLELPGLKK
jgi:general secretion pathway protein C